jgi:hypothetical protein
MFYLPSLQHKQDINHSDSTMKDCINNTHDASNIQTDGRLTTAHNKERNVL